MNLTPPLDPAVLEQSFTLYRLSRMLYVVAELDLARHLASGRLDAASLARRTHTHAPSLKSLLDALVSWGVFARDEDEHYTLTAFSQRLVPGSAQAANVPLLLGWAGFPAVYEAFGDLLHTVRTGQSALQARYGYGFHMYLSKNPELGQLYDRAMSATTEGFCQCVAAYDFSSAHHVIDVGGGQGDLALEILSRYPQLRATSYDLPEVVANVQRNDHPAHQRLELVGGDAFQMIPGGGDIYLTSTVLRCFDAEQCLRLLTNIRLAMPRYARLVAFEMVMPEQRDNLALNMANLVARVVYGGQDRTEREFVDLFEQAGLRHTRTLPTGGLLYALEAVPE